MRSQGLGSPNIPLVLDLDGTLTPSDATIEQLVLLLGSRPFSFLRAVLSGLRSRLAMKEALLATADEVAAGLPINDDVLTYALSERAAGREVHLVTASHQSVADGFAERLNAFDSSTGSTTINLKGASKAEYLVRRFPNGFAYVGDSSADRAVWSSAVSGSVVGRRGAGFRAFESAKVSVDQIFDTKSASIAEWIRQLRLHQWTKNLMLFVALFVGHQYGELSSWIILITGFVSIGLVASGTYVLNDLIDLSADRAHPTKRNRPLAAGRIKVMHGLVVAPGLVLVGLLIALALLPPRFGLLVAAYTVLTGAYSLGLKQIVLLDTLIIGSLFTLRIAMGAMLLEIRLSHWLLVFSGLFFFSLALAKRHVELVRAEASGRTSTPGRGYRVSDVRLTGGFGINATGLSVLVIILYLIDEAFDTEDYVKPELLWAIPVLIGVWLIRIWVWADRGWLDDDPVVFALKDKVSLLLGAALGGCFLLSIVGV